ncbi:BnaC03g61480D [Brassica napus]|uniref:BnaC03g61480D protein n=1 Tax=Brassica napus TaxID=3708 RepID=A0A078G7F8_BRANA|nr:BnaC03g61480D [Brassica napus]
MLSSQESSLI